MMKTDRTLDQQNMPAGEVDSAGCAPTAGSAADWHTIAADTTRQAITAALNGHAGTYTRLMEIAAHASQMEIKTTPRICRRCQGMGWVPSMTDADTDPCPECSLPNETSPSVGAKEK